MVRLLRRRRLTVIAWEMCSCRVLNIIATLELFEKVFSDQGKLMEKECSRPPSRDLLFQGGRTMQCIAIRDEREVGIPKLKT